MKPDGASSAWPSWSWAGALGLASGERAVVLHVDDVGMCEATVEAFADLLDDGLICSASVMVPCPAFSAAADLCRRRPDADVGVHLTLTSEWSGYSWGPVSAVDAGSGLTDAEGCFHRTVAALAERAEAGAVRQELAAQLARARQAGIEATHLDSHMLSALHPRFLSLYVEIACEQRLPCLLWRGLPADGGGLRLFEAMAKLPMDRPEDRLDQARRVLDGLPPGVTHFLLHPARDTPELRAIAGDWRSRVADYEVLRSRELAAAIRSSGLRLVAYRELRDASLHRRRAPCYPLQD